jgi:cell division protein FtsN
MTPSIALGLAAVVVVAAAVAAIRRFREPKTPVAGGRGPMRYSRAQLLDGRGRRAARRSPGLLRSAGIWVAAALLLGWIGLSLAQRAGGGATEPSSATIAATAPATPVAEPEELVTSLSGRLGPPPPPGEESGTGPLPEPPELAAPPPPEPPAPLAQSGFEPSEPVAVSQPAADQGADSSSLIEAAMAMAPTISRMEPLGLLLGTENDPNSPQPVRPTPMPRLRLTAPPAGDAQRDAPDPGVPARASSAEQRKYTVILGSFAKPDNADRLKDQVLAAGLTATVTRVVSDNKVWYRVMSGSFDDAQAAEAYGRELKRRDLVDNPYIKPL